MQKDAWDTLLKLAGDIRYINEGAFTNIWRHLQTSDHFYYMSTKSGDDQNIHNYFSPYPSPYDAFMNYMNILTDFDLKVKARKESLARDSTQGLAHPLLEQVIP
jgi:alpha-amylase